MSSLKSLKKGDIISPKDVTLKRTSSTNFIENLEEVYKKEVKERILINTAIKPNQIK